MERILQDDSRIIQTKKTVDWLVNNTSVNVFNPITFEGYQRSIDEKHCEKIVSFLTKNFFLPSSIICASRDEFSNDQTLYIVDGQHRVEAFRILKQKNPTRYEQIKSNELSVIVLECVPEEIEIDTFITINKTSKKVDTSLAYVLKNKINYNRSSEDISISRREYVSVEVAARLNSCEDEMWQNRISFEGAPAKQSSQLISLNAFVKSMRTLLNYFEKCNILDLKWDNSDYLEKCITDVTEITLLIWNEVKNKWPSLFEADLEKRRIVQGSIGFSAINRFIVFNLKNQQSPVSRDCFLIHLKNWFQSIRCPDKKWLPGEEFSSYSSEAGFSLIAQQLIDNMY